MKADIIEPNYFDKLDEWNDGDAPDHPDAIGVMKDVEIALNKLLREDSIARCPLCAYALRTKVFVSSEDWKWRRLWLKHCLSTDTEFIFTVIEARDDRFALKDEYEPKTLKISRERDVERIVNESILTGKNTIGSAEGKEYYLRRIALWHLRRYNQSAANVLLKEIPKERQNLSDWVCKLYPRLIGATCVGFLPIICIPEFWRYPVVVTTLDHGWKLLLTLASLFLLISYGFFKLEYVKTTGNKDWERPFRIWACGVGYAFLLSSFITVIFSGHFIGDGFKGCNDLILGFPQSLFFRYYLEIVIFFASIAQFIGIIIQFFWEEKNVTEPL